MLKATAPPALVNVGLAVVSVTGVLNVMALLLVVILPPRSTDPLTLPPTAVSVNPPAAVMVTPDGMVNKPLCVTATAPVVVALAMKMTSEDELTVTLASELPPPPTTPVNVTGPTPAVRLSAWCVAELIVSVNKI